MTISRAKIIRPGHSPPVGKPLTIFDVTQFHFGAIQLAPGGIVRGSSAVNGSVSFTKGVISFWANYDPTTSNNGDPAAIALIGGVGNQPSNNSITGCAANAANVLPSNNANTNMGCIAVFLDILGIHLVLVDKSTGNGLLIASLTYNNLGSVTFPTVWQNLGDVASQLHVTPFTFNGNSFAGLGSFIMPFPCGGGAAVTDPMQQVCNFSDASQLPIPTAQMLSEVVTVGQTTFQPITPPKFKGTAWTVTSSNFGGTPPAPGWHHYICSFDTSQLVTDVNGAQCIRAQIAMDGAGGPLGGPLMDTKAISVGSVSQPMSSQSEQNGMTGNLLVTGSDAWAIAAPSDIPIKFAYCYFGIVPSGGAFFDLTNSTNMRQFLTVGGGPTNLGAQGSNVPSLNGIFLHTGNADQTTIGQGTPVETTAPYFSWNNMNARPWSNRGMTSTDGPTLR